MGVTDPFKKWRRTLDVHPASVADKACRCLHTRLASQPRRVIVVIFIVCLSLYFWGPNVFLQSFSATQSPEELQAKCESEIIKKIQLKEGLSLDFVFGWSRESSEVELKDKYFPFVGNGVFGVSFYPTPTVYLRGGRTLSIDTKWNPVVYVQTRSNGMRVSNGFYHTNVLKGTVSHYQCLDKLQITSTFFAHRTHPNLFYQDISIRNPSDENLQVSFEKIHQPEWSSFEMDKKIDKKFVENSQLTFSGIVKNVSNHQSVGICVLYKGLWSTLEVPAHRTKHILVPMVIYYDTLPTDILTNRKSIPSSSIENKCKTISNSLASDGTLKWEQEHFSSWPRLWKTGLTISHSKASGALNNDRINATVYYVLSNVVLNKTQETKFNSTSHVQLAEGCYGGYHHTLQARNLWKDLTSFKEMEEIVNLWLLTLEKQGCHKLLTAGAVGVVQAMTLSFGGFRFSPHHLEFKIEPKFLHRDYQFRNIKFGYNIHINVSVILQENNKAVLGVSIDQSDRDYWACDGGCIDEPVKLSESPEIFPVKITDPITSILYITPDRNHMELIKDTLHVHKIVEAPAHDHHVVALHRHGSHFGGLPIMFWATVITLIVIFHLFLCKLIYNEYCGKHQERGRSRYSRLTTSTRGI